MTRDEFESGVQDGLDGAAPEPFAAALEADPAALGEFVDQLQMHRRLGLLLEPDAPDLREAVLREVRYTGDSERFAKGVVGQLKEKGGFRRRGLELAAAAFALAALGFFLLRDGAPTPAADGAELLLIVGQVPLDAGDLRVKERLERTYRVQVRPDREARPEDARGRALVLISSTIDERGVRERFRDVDVPVLCWEPRLFHDLGMIPGAVHRLDWAAAEGQTRLRTAAGTVTVTSRPAPYCWARVRADAEKVATLESDPDKAAIFRYDRGADMPGLKAPARRAGVFLFEWTAIALTPEGWALFDDSVRWCIGR
jgi:hypothetical protein